MTPHDHPQDDPLTGQNPLSISIPDAPSWCARDLPKVPSFLQKLIAKAKRQLDLDRIILFGSRARGDHRARSDYDLCFFLHSPRNWTEFVVDMHENAETLCPLDLVNRSEIRGILVNEIERKGVVLYDSRKS